MAESRRVTTVPVDWGTFDGGKVLAAVTGRSRRSSIHASRLLLFSNSGVVLGDMNLSENFGDIIAAAVNCANVVVCCVSHGTGRGRKERILFINGPRILAVRELGKEVFPDASSDALSIVGLRLLCLRLDSQDVAVFGSVNSGTLFFSSYSCYSSSSSISPSESVAAQPLWDFAEASLVGLQRGRHPAELLVLLDDGSVAVLELIAEDNNNNNNNTETREAEVLLRHHLQVSSSAAVVGAAWAAGGTLLWVLCSDGTLSGYSFEAQAGREGTILASGGGEEDEEGDNNNNNNDNKEDDDEKEEEVTPILVANGKLQFPDGWEGNTKIFMVGEGRTCGVHIALQTPTEIYFNAFTRQNLNENSLTSSRIDWGWSRSVFIWSGHLHGFSFKQCAYELLVQNELGGSPLSVISLRQNSSVLVFEDFQKRQLSHQVVSAVPDKLSELREKCELMVHELEIASSKVSDLNSTEKSLSQLMNLQHCLVATLHRERELNKEVLPYQSISMHLIKRLHTVYIQLSIFRLIYFTASGDRLDVPLYKAMGLEKARNAATECQAELRNQFEQIFDLTPNSMIESLNLWGSKDSASIMCIDAILSYLRCTDQSSLRSIIKEITIMNPATVILVLYCTFHAAECGNLAPKDINVAREEFLDNFCLPLCLRTWSQLAFMADHHYFYYYYYEENEEEQEQGEEEDEDEKNEKKLNVAEIRAAHGLGCPPLLDLIPGIINGLTYSGAYELVFQFTGCVLSFTTSENIDASVAVKLLFLAYKRGSSSMVEALYRRSRGTLWGNLATHALAWAALQTENINLLSGLITPNSNEENIVESVLRRSSDNNKSDILLMNFYILMQRYAEALDMCEHITAQEPIEAQQIQIIASHLRSLMPNGHKFNYHKCNQNTTKRNEVRQGVGKFAKSLTATLQFPLKSEEEEFAMDVARTRARMYSQRHNERPLDALGNAAVSHSREMSALAYTPTPVAALGIIRDKFRQEISRHDESRNIQQQEKEEERNILEEESDERGTLHPELSPSVRRNDTNESLLGASWNTLPPHGTTATVAPSVATLDQDALYCEAILKRSKKPCGRKRPCEYHDRVRK